MVKLIELTIIALILIPFGFILWNLNTIMDAPPVQLSFLVIAKNLASTGSFTYVGTPYTLFPPLIMFLIAAFIKVGFDGFTAWKIINLLALVLSTLLLYKLSLSISSNKIVSLVSVFLFVSTPLIMYYVLDFYVETVYVFLCILWFFLLRSNRYFFAGIVASLAFLCRLQGALLIIFGVIYLLISKDKKVISYALVAVCLPLMLGIYNFNVLMSYYHMPISLAIKPQVLYMTGVLHPDLGSNLFLPKPYLLVFMLFAYLLPIFGVFFVFGLFSKFKEYKLIGLFVLFYCLCHVTLPGGLDNIVRHLLPIVPFVSVYAAEGIMSSVGSIKHRNLCLVIILCVILITSLNMTRLEVRKTLLNRDQQLQGIRWMNKNLPINSTIVDALQEPHSIILSNYYANHNYIFSPILMKSYTNNSKYVLRQLSSTYPDNDTFLASQNIDEYADFIMIPDPIPNSILNWSSIYNFSVMTISMNPPVQVHILKNPTITIN